VLVFPSKERSFICYPLLEFTCFPRAELLGKPPERVPLENFPRERFPRTTLMGNKQCPTFFVCSRRDVLQPFPTKSIPHAAAHPKQELPRATSLRGGGSWLQRTRELGAEEAVEEA
jgi:hypothetical protein